MYYLKGKNGITLISLVVTIIVLLILAGVSIATLTGPNGLLTRASEAKIEIALGSVREALKLEQGEKIIDNEKLTPEILLAEGKVTRTVQAGENDTYYMYYAIKENAYEGMQGLGKGNIASLKDIFLIDDNLNVKYIASNGKEYGDSLNNKVLEDETEIRFSSKAFSEYISKKTGVAEDELKFKWMKNQTQLTIADSSIDSLQDLIFFPNLIDLQLGDGKGNNTQVTTMNGIEKCSKLTHLRITSGEPDKDYSAISTLNNLKFFYRNNGNDYDNIISALKYCENLEGLTLSVLNIENMARISELGNLKSLNLSFNQISKIEGLENKKDLTSLNIMNNKISKIEGLEELSNLTVLDLRNNQITDIIPLAINSKLTTLDLKGNKQIDGNRNNYTEEELEALNKIGEILDRNGNIYLDLEQLGLFTNYKEINLHGQGLTTLEPLRGFTKLTKLSLTNNQLTLEDEASQEILRSMTNLKDLNLKDNKITNITVINSLKNLTGLNLQGVKNNINLAEIEDIISNLSSLKVNNTDLKTIVNCDASKITKLSVAHSGITELPDLSKFNRLTTLYLVGNSISNLNEIIKITSLKDLRLSDTRGRLMDFSQLTNLKYLGLENNYLNDADIEKLKTLKNHTNLTIDLRGNAIINATALLELNQNTTIVLSNNINLTQQAKEALKERFGNKVTF